MRDIESEEEIPRPPVRRYRGMPARLYKIMCMFMQASNPRLGHSFGVGCMCYAMQVCTFDREYMVVDTFAGEANIAKAFKHKGLPALALDIARDSRDDTC